MSRNINRDNIDVEKYEDMYRDMLNEAYEEIKIGCCTFLPAQVLKECDPTAFRCGLLDYVDSLEDDELLPEDRETDGDEEEEDDQEDGIADESDLETDITTFPQGSTDAETIHNWLVDSILKPYKISRDGGQL